jgi:anaerobic dimethyl sulfoxide reductase subunit B (iron-sulfur subunit)
MKREADGIVIVDKETCLGSTCGVCQQDCPYDAPQFGPESDAKMQKCDLCLDRWIKGMKPVCVEACPVRALDAGPLDELESKYGKTKAAIGFAFSDASWPSLVLKAKDK